MAIYHFSAQVISRGKGQSAVAAAAYRSGERLIDERTGEAKFYQRDVMPDTLILAPHDAPAWVTDRQRLWNAVEASEVRKNSQLAREINVALPRELSEDSQKALIRDFVQTQFVDRGMVADLAIHRDDPNNPHAHVMLTTREISQDGFEKKNRDWNDRALLNDWREQWAEHANQALTREGIQERLSHLSHEARGLEVLPTVHLGHVAHEMENRGVETDRGNLNREREAYNQVVVDLERYREAKEALEQKHNQERWTTPSERVHLQEAERYLKGKPTFDTITERLQQLEKWEKNLNNNQQYLHWKDDTLRKGEDHFKWIRSFNQEIVDQQYTIDQIKWGNPLKIKQNRAIKEQAEQRIDHLKGEIAFHDRKLNYHRDKLGFQTENEFKAIEQQHTNDRPAVITKNQQQRQVLHQERDVLQNAEKALQRRFVRELASHYPKHPEMTYLSFKTAQDLQSLNERFDRYFTPNDMRDMQQERNERVNAYRGAIRDAENHQVHLNNASHYLEGYNEAHAIVKKYETNPFLNGKMRVSKSARATYESALQQRDTSARLMKKEGVQDAKDLSRQQASCDKTLAKIPDLKGKTDDLLRRTGILDGIVKGIEQATQAMDRQNQQQERERQRRLSKGKKYTYQRDEWEMER